MHIFFPFSMGYKILVGKNLHLHVSVYKYVQVIIYACPKIHTEKYSQVNTYIYNYTHGNAIYRECGRYLRTN